MAKLGPVETVTINLDGAKGRINVTDYDPDIHDLWTEEDEAEAAEAAVKETAKVEGKGDLTPAEKVPSINSWRALEAFVEENEVDYKVDKEAGTLKDAKAALLEVLTEPTE